MATNKTMNKEAVNISIKIVDLKCKKCALLLFGINLKQFQQRMQRKPSILCNQMLVIIYGQGTRLKIWQKERKKWSYEYG